MDFTNLPGAEWIAEGIQDLKDDRKSIAALLVAIGWPRLHMLIPDLPPTQYENPEHQLYQTLHAEHPGSAHSRYNALIRRLVSFERALSCVA